MSTFDEFQSNIEALPNILQRKYTLLRDLDKSLQEIQRQNDQRCEQEIEDLKRGIKSGNITPNSSLHNFSADAVEEQKHAIRIADEKVALAVQAYDLVDAHVQQLDQYLKKLDEELRRAERETAINAGSAPSHDGTDTKTGKSGETSNRGRKRTRNVAVTGSTSSAAAMTTANPATMELDLPVDPNEPTYCLCNQVSYGEMVACDNPDCKIEWFHFGCVGLKEQPKGKWYCSNCVGNKKRRKTR